MVLFTHPCCHDVRAALHLDLAPGGGIAVADVAEELADPGCQVMQLCLGGNLLRDSGAATIAEALKRNASLAALNLEGNGIGAPGATKMAEALQDNNALMALGLAFNRVGGDGAAETVKGGVRQLDLQGNGIGAPGATKVARALQENRTLTELDLGSNKIGEGKQGRGIGGAWESAELLRRGAAAWGGAAGGWRHEGTVRMWRDSGDEGATRLAEALRVNCTLRTLTLQFNNIGERGARAVARALASNATLTALCLYGNRVRDAGATALAEALRVNKTLGSVVTRICIHTCIEMDG